MRRGAYIPANHWGRLYLRGASPDVKLVACYLMTCAHSTSAGVVRADATLMASDLGMYGQDMAAALGELMRRHFVVPYTAPEVVGQGTAGPVYSAAFGEIHAWAVPAILDAEPVINPNVGKRVAKDLGDLLGGGQGRFWKALLDGYLSHEKNLPAEFMARVREAATWEKADSEGNYALAMDAQRNGGDALAGVDTYDALGGRTVIRSDTLAAVAYAKAVADSRPAVALADAWNDLCHRPPADLPMVDLDADLDDAAAARVAQLGGVDNIPVLMAKVEASDILMGRAPDGSGNIYRLTFAKLCKESLFSSIMEGRFDNKVKP